MTSLVFFFFKSIEKCNSRRFIDATYFYFFLFQCLVIVVFVLARAGFEGSPVNHLVDPYWITSIACGAYVIILATIIITYILGDTVPPKMVIDILDIL